MGLNVNTLYININESTLLCIIGKAIRYDGSEFGYLGSRQSFQKIKSAFLTHNCQFEVTWEIQLEKMQSKKFQTIYAMYWNWSMLRYIP